MPLRQRFVRPLAALACTLLAAGPAAAFSYDTVAAVRGEDGVLTVVWSQPGPVDVLVAEAPGLPEAKMRRLSDDDMDGVHAWTPAPGSRPFILLRAETTGETIRLAERVLPLQGGSNFRDVGGYPAAGGKHVRWGAIYRSGAMPRLTEADRRAISALGVRTLVDLRSLDERQISPTDWRSLSISRYTAVDYSASELFEGLAAAPANPYSAWPLALKRQYRQIFDDLLEAKGPALFNCSAGQDRTGLATALVLTALGVPREVILADYHLSTVHRRPANEMADVDMRALAPTNAFARYMVERGWTGAAQSKPQPLYNADGEALLAVVLRQIEARYGSVERYLDVELGVDAVDLLRLRAVYLE